MTPDEMKQARLDEAMANLIGNVHFQQWMKTIGDMREEALRFAMSPSTPEQGRFDALAEAFAYTRMLDLYQERLNAAQNDQPEQPPTQ